MEPTRILVVANRTAAAPRLLDEVRRRAELAPCEFALLIPDVNVHGTADWTLEVALPILRRTARGPVEGIIGGPEPLESVKAELERSRYDEIIVSTLPRRVSRWLRRDLVGQIARLGLPVTTVTPRRRADRAADDRLARFAGMGGGPGIP
ncbi:hypothetical protein [Candidatus Solirubrobacter pratensis]|uniref:hypothetical protein n=1 Tax=Candidatus Solirubrobacter pratensis TaxID=1298857 RepID=UPI0004232E45|nr:hypothetical protein [Candidatus Solirubrobacter pratensis]